MLQHLPRHERPHELDVLGAVLMLGAAIPLILALILDPVAITDVKGIAAVTFASVWAISSKFILAVGRKHLFNPAALAFMEPAGASGVSSFHVPK